MGCAASRIDNEGRVQICKERKKLMKHLVRFRGEFAEAQLAYLRALRNTGGTLRQFTEPELLEPETATYSTPVPSSSPRVLPPSPPPLPPFSPDIRSANGSRKDVSEKDDVEVETHGSGTPPFPVPNSSWYNWDPFGVPSPSYYQNVEASEPTEDEWVDAKSDFEEDQAEEDDSYEIVSNPTTEISQSYELTRDNASVTTSYTEENTDRAVVECRSKTLYGIIVELDDCFLKASTGGKEIAVFMELSKDDSSLSSSFRKNISKYLILTLELIIVFL